MTDSRPASVIIRKRDRLAADIKMLIEQYEIDTGARVTKVEFQASTSGKHGPPLDTVHVTVTLNVSS